MVVLNIQQMCPCISELAVEDMADTTMSRPEEDPTMINAFQLITAKDTFNLATPQRSSVLYVIK